MSNEEDIQSHLEKVASGQYNGGKTIILDPISGKLKVVHALGSSSSMAEASNDAVPVDKFASLLQCSICLETLKDPRTLPCFHSYCNVCLEKYIKHHHDESSAVKYFNCPVCRTKFTLGSRGVPRNHFICSMLDVMVVQNRVKSVPCSHCEEASIGRCIICELFMCKKCLKRHKDWPGFRDHTVLSMEELSKPENKAKIKGRSHCKKHDQKKLKFYCETCNETICRRCMDFDHLRPDHKCSSLETIASEKLEALKINHSTLESKLSEGNEALQELTNEALSLEHDMKQARSKINERKCEILTTIEQSLERNAKCLIDEAEKIFRKKQSKVVEETEQMKTYVDKVKATLDMSSTLIANGNDEEIVSTQKFVQENVEKVESEYPRRARCLQDDKILRYNDDDIYDLLMDYVAKKFEECLAFDPETGKLKVTRVWINREELQDRR